MKFLGFVFFSIAITSPVNAQEFNTYSDKLTPLFLIENFGEGAGATDPLSVRGIDDVALGLIKSFEGWIPHAYNDPAGYCTIGYGHLIALKLCQEVALGEFSNPLTETAGAALLRRDTEGAQRAVLAAVNVDLNDQQFGALVSFVFNVGGTNFRNSTLLKLLDEGNYQGAGDQFLRWTRADGRVLSGLVYRRACERSLFNGETVIGNDGQFNRATCTSAGAASVPGELIDIEVGE